MAVENILRIIAGDVLFLSVVWKGRDCDFSLILYSKPPNCEFFGMRVNDENIQRMQEILHKYSIQP